MTYRRPVEVVALRVVGEWPYVPPGYGVDAEGFVLSHGERMEFRGMAAGHSWVKNNPGFHALPVYTGAWETWGE